MWGIVLSVVAVVCLVPVAHAQGNSTEVGWSNCTLVNGTVLNCTVDNCTAFNCINATQVIPLSAFCSNGVVPLYLDDMGTIVNFSQPIPYVVNGTYENNCNGTWLLSTDPGRVIAVYFDIFWTQVGLDKVLFYDGDSTMAPYINNLSGKFSSQPPAAVSTGHTLTVQFKSDSAVTRMGFVGNARSYLPFEIPYPKQCNGTGYVPSLEPPPCGRSGILESPEPWNGITGYYNDRDCGWLLQAPANGTIRASFLEVSMENGLDFVYLYDGPTTDAPLIGACTGVLCPDSVSTQEYILVRLVTNDVIYRTGFQLRWTVMKGDNHRPECPEDPTYTSTTGFNGTFTTFPTGTGTTTGIITSGSGVLAPVSPPSSTSFFYNKAAMAELVVSLLIVAGAIAAVCVCVRRYRRERNDYQHFMAEVDKEFPEFLPSMKNPEGHLSIREKRKSNRLSIMMTDFLGEAQLPDFSRDPNATHMGNLAPRRKAPSAWRRSIADGDDNVAYFAPDPNDPNLNSAGSLGSLNDSVKNPVFQGGRNTPEPGAAAGTENLGSTGSGFGSMRAAPPRPPRTTRPGSLTMFFASRKTSNPAGAQDAAAAAVASRPPPAAAPVPGAPPMVASSMPAPTSPIATEDARGRPISMCTDPNFAPISFDQAPGLPPRMSVDSDMPRMSVDSESSVPMESSAL